MTPPLIDNTGWSREEQDDRGYVYFAQPRDDPTEDVKIGFAVVGRLKQRLFELNTGVTPRRALEVIAVVPHATLKDESWWKRRFRRDHVDREVFRFSGDMQAEVKRLASPFGPMPAVLAREFPPEQLSFLDKPEAVARMLDAKAEEVTAEAEAYVLQRDEWRATRLTELEAIEQRAIDLLFAINGEPAEYIAQGVKEAARNLLDAMPSLKRAMAADLPWSTAILRSEEGGV